MKYVLAIIIQLLVLTPAFAADCLKSGDVVRGSLGRAEGGVGDNPTSRYGGEVLTLEHARCFVVDDNDPTEPIGEVEFNDEKLPDTVLRSLEGNIVEVKIEYTSDSRVREISVAGTINNVVIDYGDCARMTGIAANPDLNTPKQYDGKITASKRVNLYARPAEACKSSIFVVNKDPVEVLAETDKYAFVRYVSKQKISFYGWVPKDAIARN